MTMPKAPRFSPQSREGRAYLRRLTSAQALKLASEARRNATKCEGAVLDALEEHGATGRDTRWRERDARRRANAYDEWHSALMYRATR